jgi:hypothetical protein
LRNGGNAAVALRTVAPEHCPTAALSQQRAHRLKNHPKVQSILQQAAARSASALQIALERYDVAADRVAAEMATAAFSDISQVCDWGSKIDPKTKQRTYWLHVKDLREIDPNAVKAIAKVRRKPDGTLEVELSDKQAAIMNLARLKGYIQDKPTDANQNVQLIIQR